MNLSLDRKAITSALGKLKFRTQAFINGEFSPSSSGKTYAAMNPANGKKLAEVAACEPADVNRAAAAARKPLREPGNCLRPLHSPCKRVRERMSPCNYLRAASEE